MAMIETVDRRARGLRPRAEQKAHTGEFLRRLDWLLFAAVFALVSYGLWAIGGITQSDPGGSAAPRQFAYAVAGLVLLGVAIFVDLGVYRRFKQAIYIGALAMMGIVLLSAAAEVRGSRRWLDIGPVRFQPSEFGKVLFTLALAAFIADRVRRINEWRTVAEIVALGVPPIVLVFMQPDLGTALVYGSMLAAVLFVAGTRWLHLSVLAGVTVGVAMLILWLLPAAGVQVLRDYQHDRLTGFLNPDSDPQGTTYNVHQSVTAVGAGGVDGRGVAEATQTRWNYLPEHATDFAFASLAEQRGFLGVAFLLLLYMLVVWRGLKVMAVARDLYSAIVAGGIVVAFLFQVFVNVGMTIGIAPVTGIPLPFVSVGGSSLVTNLLAMGILQSINARGVDRRSRR
jgi:rod shape determining protein RodA